MSDTSGARKILVSGCLNGPPIRYNSTNVAVVSEIWDRWLAEGRLVHLCPELSAGFPIPRPPAEIVGATAGEVLSGDGVVREDDGTDVTGLFVAGAQNALAKARSEGCVMAVLTDGSPSCGSTYQYDGTFTGATRPGSGVTAQMLRDNGIAVFSEEQLEEADHYLSTLDGR